MSFIDTAVHVHTHAGANILLKHSSLLFNPVVHSIVPEPALLVCAVHMSHPTLSVFIASAHNDNCRLLLTLYNTFLFSRLRRCFLFMQSQQLGQAIICSGSWPVFLKKPWDQLSDQARCTLKRLNIPEISFGHPSCDKYISQGQPATRSAASLASTMPLAASNMKKKHHCSPRQPLQSQCVERKEEQTSCRKSGGKKKRSVQAAGLSKSKRQQQGGQPEDLQNKAGGHHCSEIQPLQQQCAAGKKEEKKLSRTSRIYKCVYEGPLKTQSADNKSIFAELRRIVGSTDNGDGFIRLKEQMRKVGKCFSGDCNKKRCIGCNWRMKCHVTLGRLGETRLKVETGGKHGDQKIQPEGDKILTLRQQHVVAYEFDSQRSMTCRGQRPLRAVTIM